MAQFTSDEKKQLTEYIEGLTNAADIARKALAGEGGTLADFAAECDRLQTKYEDLVEKIVKFYKDNGLFDTMEPKSTKEIAEELLADPDLFDSLQLPFMVSIPNSDPLNLLFRAFANKFNIDEQGGSHGEQITTTEAGKKIVITKTRGESTIQIIIKDKGILNDKNTKTFAKLFCFCIQELNLQHYKGEIEIDLQKLVDLGMYKTTGTARRALFDFFDLQQNINLAGKLANPKRGKKNEPQFVTEEEGLFFYHITKSGTGLVTLYYNEKINLDFIASYYSVIPQFAYGLSNNGFLLVRYIFYLARQNTAAIKKDGSFNIKLENIRENLGLPFVEEVKNRKYKQFIFDPIENAVEEIEEAMRKRPEEENFKEPSLTFSFHGTDTTKPKQWLAGFLEVGFNNELAQEFIRRAEKAEKEREERRKAYLKVLASYEVKASKTTNNN